jgi:hypothetical protein
MEELVQLLAALLRIALIPLLGYAFVRFAHRWPRATLALLLAVTATGTGALGYAWQDGFNVARIPGGWHSNRRPAGGASPSAAWL